MTALEQSRIRYNYDRVGNLKSETYYKLTYTDANIYTGAATEAALFSKTYDYYPQNWLQHARLNGKLQVTYEYDRTGNQRKVSTYVDDATPNTVQYEYDSFGRIATIIQPDGAKTFRQYDALDNLTYECDNNWSIMRWEYDALGRLVKVDEPDVQADTYYRYDPDGNLVQKEMSNGYQISYNFNPRGQLTKEHQLTNGELLIDYYGYYAGGDLKYKINPRGIKEEYSYNLRGLPEQVTYYTYGQTNYETAYWSVHGNKAANGDLVAADPLWQQKGWTDYTYNEVGSMLTSKMFEGSPAAWSQLNEVAMEYNSCNQVTKLTRKIPDNLPAKVGDTPSLNTYVIRYHYDVVGNVTGMLYPESNVWLKYQYNADNRLAKIPGFVEGAGTDGFSYDQSGRLTDIRYANQVNTHYELDGVGRIKDIQVSEFCTNENKLDSLNYHYIFDGVGNVTERNQNKYHYDSLDRLTYAEIAGIFYDEANITTGHVHDDILCNKWISFDLAEDVEIKLDYAAGSIGVHLGELTPNIGRIVVINDQAVPGTLAQENRIEKRNLQILKSTDNITYTQVPANLWELEKDPGGNLIITFKENVEAKYLKVHSSYDDRNRDGTVKDLSQFKNELGKIALVYKCLEKVTEEYGYDNVGNREWRKVTGARTAQTNYSYYLAGDGSLVRTNRLLEAKTVFDGQKVTDAFAYQYDRAGNMVTKGNIYQIRDAISGNLLSDQDSLQPIGAWSSAVNVDYTAMDGIYVEYWEYGYNLRNRMESALKNGQVTAQYSYDYSGKRIRSEREGTVLHFVYGLGGELVYQTDVTGAEDEFYIHALGRVMVQVVGGELSYYHHDNLGSTVLMTDDVGKRVFAQDYEPFGQTLYVEQIQQPGFSFTGQREDAGVGLYYYNARYYDPELGRFTREDEYQGNLFRPQTQHSFVYVLNNPIKYIDPAGFSENIGHYADWWLFSRNEFSNQTYEMTIINEVYLNSKGEKLESQVTKVKGYTNVFNSYYDKDGVLNHTNYKIYNEFGELIDPDHNVESSTEEKTGIWETIDNAWANASLYFTWQKDPLEESDFVERMFGSALWTLGVSMTLVELYQYGQNTYNWYKLNKIATKTEGTLYKYNMINNPGPLANMKGQPASNFSGGQYNKIQLESDRILFRLGKKGGGTNALGQWFTYTPVKSAVLGRVDYAIKSQWINLRTGALTGISPLESIYVVKIPAGTIIYEGPTAYQGGINLGGHNHIQVFVPEPWNIRGIEILKEIPLP